MDLDGNGVLDEDEIQQTSYVCGLGTFAPLGEEFRVNTYTTGEQSNTSVASLSGGGFVVTWQSNGQDGSAASVFGQLYDRDGAVGEEFRVNTYTTSHQMRPSVAALLGGGFVVTWQSEGQDGSGYGIYGQRYGVRAE